MTELSMDELQAETGELLPERETLSVVIIGQSANALAGQAFVAKAVAVNNANVAIDSFNNVASFNHVFGF